MSRALICRRARPAAAAAAAKNRKLPGGEETFILGKAYDTHMNWLKSLWEIVTVSLSIDLYAGAVLEIVVVVALNYISGIAWCLATGGCAELRKVTTVEIISGNGRRDSEREKKRCFCPFLSRSGRPFSAQSALLNSWMGGLMWNGQPQTYPINCENGHRWRRHWPLKHFWKNGLEKALSEVMKHLFLTHGFIYSLCVRLPLSLPPLLCYFGSFSTLFVQLPLFNLLHHSCLHVCRSLSRLTPLFVSFSLIAIHTACIITFQWKKRQLTFFNNHCNMWSFTSKFLLNGIQMLFRPSYYNIYQIIEEYGVIT